MKPERVFLLPPARCPHQPRGGRLGLRQSALLALQAAGSLCSHQYTSNILGVLASPADYCIDLCLNGRYIALSVSVCSHVILVALLMWKKTPMTCRHFLISTQAANYKLQVARVWRNTLRRRHQLCEHGASWTGCRSIKTRCPRIGRSWSFACSCSGCRYKKQMPFLFLMILCSNSSGISRQEEVSCYFLHGEVNQRLPYLGQ